MATLDLRPRSGVELIDASFQFLRENFALLFTAVAVTYAPIAVLEYQAALDPANVLLAIVKGLVAWFLSAFAQAVVVGIVAARYMGEEITAADALRAVCHVGRVHRAVRAGDHGGHQPIPLHAGDAALLRPAHPARGARSRLPDGKGAGRGERSGGGVTPAARKQSIITFAA